MKRLRTFNRPRILQAYLWCAVAVIGIGIFGFNENGWAQHRLAQNPTKSQPSSQQGERESMGLPIRIIVMSIHPAPTDVHALEQAIVSQLADLDAVVDFYHTQQRPHNLQQQDAMVTRLLTANGAAAVFVISPLEDRSLRILLQRGGTIESASRLVDVSDGMPLHEAFAVIVRATAGMLIDQSRTATPIQSVSEQSPLPPQKPPIAEQVDDNAPDIKQSVPPLLTADAGFSITNYSTDIDLSPGLALGLGWQPAPHFRVGLGGIFLSRESKQTSDLSITLRHHPLYVTTGYTRATRRLLVEGGAAFQLDVVTERFHTDNNTVSVWTSQTEFQPALQLYLLTALAITPRWNIYFRLNAAISLRHTKYTVSTTEGRQTILETRPIQPSASIGIRFHFF